MVSWGMTAARPLRYDLGMRYPEGGGLTAERHQFREGLRLEAAERFARGEASSVIAQRPAGQCPVGVAVAVDVERRRSAGSAVAGTGVVAEAE